MVDTFFFSQVASPPSIIWTVFLCNQHVSHLKGATSNSPTQKKSTRKHRKMHWNYLFWPDIGHKKTTVQLVSRGKNCFFWVAEKFAFSCRFGGFQNLRFWWLAWCVDRKSRQMNRRYCHRWMQHLGPVSAALQLDRSCRWALQCLHLGSWSVMNVLELSPLALQTQLGWITREKCECWETRNESGTGSK